MGASDFSIPRYPHLDLQLAGREPHRLDVVTASILKGFATGEWDELVMFPLQFCDAAFCAESGCHISQTWFPVKNGVRRLVDRGLLELHESKQSRRAWRFTRAAQALCQAIWGMEHADCWYLEPEEGKGSGKPASLGATTTAGTR